MNELPRSILIIAAFITIRNRRKGKPQVRLFEDRLETKYALQKEYRKYYFKDGRKPLKIKLSDLDVPVEALYKNIVERMN